MAEAPSKMAITQSLNYDEIINSNTTSKLSGEKPHFLGDLSELSFQTEITTSLPFGAFRALNESSYVWSNRSRTSEPTRDLWKDIPLGVVLGLLCLMTFIGNAMVLHAVRTDRRLQSVSNMFIVSLAIADLIVGLIVMPISAVYIFTEDWLFGVAVCQTWIGTDYIASTASILNLFILSLDRYWSVTMPLKYLRKRTKRRALIMISLVWGISSLWLVPIVGWHYFENGGVRTVPSDACEPEYATSMALKVITGILNFYLPLAIMYALYAKIFMEIRKRSEFELGQRTSGGCKTEIPRGYSSDTDETVPRGEGDSDTFSEGNNTSNLNRLAEQQRFILRSRHGKQDTDTEEEIYTEKSSVLEKGGYTAVNLHAQDFASSTTDQYVSSDAETKLEYMYDESVLDHTTEKVQPFLSGGVRDTQIRPSASPKPKHVTYVETSLSKPLSTSTDRRQRELMLDNSHRIGKNNTFMVNRLKCRSELSPRQNKEDLNTDKSAYVIFPFRLRRPKAKRKRGVESALMKHAMQWREKILRQKNKPSAQLRKEIKAARQLGVIMGAFTLCFLPYFVMFMVVAFCDGCIDGGLLTAFTWVGYLNSTLNPLLYPLCNANFRRKFRQMLKLSNRADTRSSRLMTPRASMVPGNDHTLNH